MTLSPASSRGSGGGSGTVTSVTAGDTSIVVGGTATDPTIETASLAVIAADHPAAGAVAMNAQKITGLANGAAAQDAAAFGQIPTALPPNGAAGGDLVGTFPNPTIGNNKVSVAKLSTAATLDAIATAYATAGNIAMAAHKLTGLAAGSGAGDSIRWEQVFAAGAIPIADIADPGAGKFIGSSSGAAAIFPPGHEFDYVQITAGVTIISTTEGAPTTLITSDATTFDGGAVMLEAYSPNAQTAAATGGEVIFILLEGATNLGRIGILESPAASASAFPITLRFRLTPTVGSHTYILAAFQSGGNGSWGAGAGGAATLAPAFLRFTKV